MPRGLRTDREGRETEGFVAGAVPLAGYYFFHFATLGIVLPFLPAYLTSLSLSPSQIGLLLALGPGLMLFVPPLWGGLADRTGRADLILRVLAAGALAFFSALTFVRGFYAIAVALGAHALFHGAITTMADSLTLQRVERRGGTFPRIRLFGSIGFVLASGAFGLAVDVIDVRVVWAGMVTGAGALAWSFAVRARGATTGRRSLLAGLDLLRTPGLKRVLAATAFHWMACAPYHGYFAIYVSGSLGLAPWVIGLATGVGVSAEVLVMWLYPGLARRFDDRAMLILAFGASAVRWIALSLLVSPWTLVLVNVLHGMTFAAFYVAAVGAVSTRVPPRVRASGQGLFVAATFGLGGLLGYLSAGMGFELLGGQRLFLGAGLLELLPLALVWRLRRVPSERGAPASLRPTE